MSFNGMVVRSLKSSSMLERERERVSCCRDRRKMNSLLAFTYGVNLKSRRNSQRHISNSGTSVLCYENLVQIAKRAQAVQLH